MDQSATQTRADATGTPFWFGPAHRPLAGRLHRPADGNARAAVVLCPAAGYEYALAYPSFVALAEALAAVGIAALRLDYDGCAESWGDEEDPDRVAAWETSIELAVAQLRELGATRVGLVGLRLGALLAARAASSLDTAALVLWDPVVGSRYARALSVTAAVQRNHAPDGAIAVDGYVVTDQTLADLRTLTLPVPLPAVPTLALLRPGDALRERLASATVVDALAQPELFGDDTLAAEIPEATVAAITAWLDQNSPAESTPIRAPERTVVEVDGLRQRFVTAADLACTVVEAISGPAGGTPTVLMVNTMIDPRIGPSRSWVGWSRELAGLGFRAIRADLGGIGDSVASPGAEMPRPYAPHLVSDVRRLVEALADESGIALVGLCSGARNALDAAGSAAITDLLLINPVLNDRRVDLESVRHGYAGLLDAQVITSRQHLRHRVAGHLPAPAWWLIHRLGLMKARTAALEQAVAAGTQVLLVYGRGDFTHIKPAANAVWAFASMRRTGRFSVVEVETDHALFDPIGRRDALAPLTRHLTERYPAR